MATEEELAICKIETIKHIESVRGFIMIMLDEMVSRLQKHDASKLEEPELSIFAENTHKLAKTVFGSAEYDDLLVQVKPALDHHYANNRHHPEHWKDGINDMTLIDLIEMLCDWKAATSRNKNGNIRKSLEHNSKRFGINKQLSKVMENTIREHFPQ